MSRRLLRLAVLPALTGSMLLMNASADAQPCKKKFEGFRFLQVERASAAQEYRLSSTDPKISFTAREGHHGIRTAFACLFCSGLAQGGVVSFGVSENGREIDADDPLTALQALLQVGPLPHMIGSLGPYQRVGAGLPIRLQALVGTVAQYVSEEDAFRPTLVMFSATDGCATLFGAFNSQRVESKGRFAEVVAWVQTLTVTSVPPGSTHQLDPVPFGAPPLDEPSPPMPFRPFSLDDLKAIRGSAPQ